jgi:TetR/AcrR family fatty acid metabolism transcriptional regulator
MTIVSIRTKAALVEEFRTSSIQEAAVRVISARGIEGASMQAVAAEAGIAKGTIYLYFKNREDMIARTADWAVAQLTKRLEPLLAESNRDPFPVRLRQIVETKIEFLHDHREVFRLYREVCQPEESPAVTSKRHRRRYEYLTSLAALLRRAMKRGEVQRADPERLALFIAEGVHAVMIRRLNEAKSPEPSVEARWIVDLVLHGLAREAKP